MVLVTDPTTTSEAAAGNSARPDSALEAPAYLGTPFGGRTPARHRMNRKLLWGIVGLVTLSATIVVVGLLTHHHRVAATGGALLILSMCAVFILGIVASRRAMEGPPEDALFNQAMAAYGSGFASPLSGPLP